jgi:hypothetical protein
MTVLACLPQSIGSWNYSITFSNGVKLALVKYNYWSDQGGITLESSCYEIRHVWYSSEWTLELDGRVVAVAIKHPFYRFFDISYGSQNIVLRADSPFLKPFIVQQAGRLLGTIKPMHSFTRQASIDCSSSITIPVQIFLFWLTALMWKRSANRSSNNTSFPP